MTKEQKIKRAKELYGNLVYPKTHIELFVDGYLAGVKELEEENRLLGERCNQLLKDKGDLTDKIADIKANCDLAIEGRDVKIKELEQENNNLLDVINNQDVKIADLEWQLQEVAKDNDYYQAQNKRLEEQIEKMKNCWNCDNWNWKHSKCEKKLKGDCFKASKWQLRR